MLWDIDGWSFALFWENEAEMSGRLNWDTNTAAKCVRVAMLLLIDDAEREQSP